MEGLEELVFKNYFNSVRCTSAQIRTILKVGKDKEDEIIKKSKRIRARARRVYLKLSNYTIKNRQQILELWPSKKEPTEAQIQLILSTRKKYEPIKEDTEPYSPLSCRYFNWNDYPNEYIINIIGNKTKIPIITSFNPLSELVINHIVYRATPHKIELLCSHIPFYEFACHIEILGIAAPETSIKAMQGMFLYGDVIESTNLAIQPTSKGGLLPDAYDCVILTQKSKFNCKQCKRLGYLCTKCFICTNQEKKNISKIRPGYQYFKLATKIKRIEKSNQLNGYTNHGEHEDLTIYTIGAIENMKREIENKIKIKGYGMLTMYTDHHILSSVHTIWNNEIQPFPTFLLYILQSYKAKYITRISFNIHKQIKVQSFKITKENVIYHYIDYVGISLYKKECDKIMYEYDKFLLQSGRSHWIKLWNAISPLMLMVNPVLKERIS